MRVRVLAAVAALCLFAGLAPAQFYYANAAAPDGTEVGVLIDAAGQHAAIKPFGGVPFALATPAGLNSPSGNKISPDAGWAAGTAGGWYSANGPGWMFRSYATLPVRWDVDTGLPEVLPVPAYTVYSWVTTIRDDGSADGFAVGLNINAGVLALYP